MNMEQPDPDGLFDQFKWQRQRSPDNPSVSAQISERPLPLITSPAVSGTVQPAPSASVSLPENPLLDLSRSGELKKLLALKEAQKKPPDNPLLALSQKGVVKKLLLMKEDKAYQDQLKVWENRNTDPLTGMQNSNFFPSPTAGALPKPEAPARDLKQIETDWQMGVQNLRAQEYYLSLIHI